MQQASSTRGEPLHVLIVEDSQDDITLILRELRRGGYDPHYQQVQDAAQFSAALLGQSWDIIISDYSMPQFSGLGAIELCAAHGVDTPFILVSGTVGEEEAVQAMRAGAQDYLMKDNLPRLAPAVRRELQEARARRERRRTEARLASILDTAADAIIGIDEAHCIVFFNQGAEQIFGWTTAELLGRPIGVLLPSQPGSRHNSSIESRIALVQAAPHSQQQAEVSGRRKDGGDFPAELSLARFVQDDGVYHTVILRDISDRKAAQKALREADRRAIGQYERLLQRLIKLAQSFGAAQDLLAVYRALGAFVAESAPCNGLFIALYDANQQLRTCVYAFSEDVEEDVSQLPRMPLNENPQSRAIQSGEVVVVDDYRAATTGLSPIRLGLDRDPRLPQSCVAVPMSVKGRIIGVFEAQSVQPAAYTEEHVTALRMAANLAAVAIENNRLLQKTQEQARHVQSVLDTVPEAVILLDTEHRVILTNPVARSYLPILASGGENEILTHLGDTPLHEILRRAGQTGSGRRQELHLDKPGRIYEIAAQPVAQDATAGWVVVLRDVTGDRLRQEHHQRQERLATVGQLAAGIAHDFNNVMAIIMLYSDTLLRSPDHDQRLRYLQTIRDQSEHAANLIAQILDFSRRSVMERTFVDLFELVQDSTDFLQRTLPESINITLQAEEGQYLCQADATRLRQLLVNLAINARDAMPDGGEMTLSLSRIRVAQEYEPLPEMQPGSWIRLDVRDTGSGISEENMPHLFEPFFTTKQPGQGTGLGLAQVYGIVKQHGGEIGVESRLGHGTTFTIYLPALDLEVERSTKQSLEETAASQTGSGESILLVEDNEKTRQAIQEALEILGYQVITAANGLEALRTFNSNEQPIDLVLSDLIMPEMGGLAFRQALLEVDPQVKIILMTGYPLAEEGRETLEQGDLTWIQKPFTMPELAGAVRKLLSS